MERDFAITDILSRNGLRLDRVAVQLLRQYEELLRQWNLSVNLVSRRDQARIAENHILHSLSILCTVTVPDAVRMLDLGTGGGLPGIPLAIARPDLDVVLLDSIRKKIRAVDDIVARLGLRNVRTCCARAEDVKEKPGFAGTFDIVVSRGVATLTELIRWSEPLARKGRNNQESSDSDRRQGLPYLLCLKGGDLEGEIARATVKTGRKNISVVDIIFRKGDGPDFEGKKLVLVPLYPQ